MKTASHFQRDARNTSPKDRAEQNPGKKGGCVMWFMTRRIPVAA